MVCARNDIFHGLAYHYIMCISVDIQLQQIHMNQMDADTTLLLQSGHMIMRLHRDTCGALQDTFTGLPYYVLQFKDKQRIEKISMQ